MAPNVKQIAHIADILGNLDIGPVQPKFLPLTQQAQQEEHDQPKEQERVENKPSTTDSSYSYWDWPAEEESRDVEDLFSAAHIESNLKLSTPDSDVEVVSSLKNNVDSENYWDERVETNLDSCPVEESKPQHKYETVSGYWDWPNNSACHRENMIESILEDEFARQQVSSGRIQQHLKEYANKTNVDTRCVRNQNDLDAGYWDWNSAVIAKHVLDVSHPNRAYWDERMEESNSKSKQSDAILERILQDELIRQMLSIGHIQEVEQDVARHSRSRNSGSEDYWCWLSPVKENARYWDWDTVTESYWVW